MLTTDTDLRLKYLTSKVVGGYIWGYLETGPKMNVSMGINYNWGGR